MVKHWVLVGDAKGARVFESDALLEELRLVDDISFSHERVRHDGDAGHSSEHLPGAGHGSEQAHHDPHKVTEERYARAVAQALNEAEVAHRFERLIIAAPARFLGDVRQGLSVAAGRRVVASFHHDWTRLGLRELSAAIRKNLPDTAGLA